MRREVWPVMLTPYTERGEVDYNALAALVDWYEENGVHGLFAVCQSSEMFYLSLRERVEIASFVKKHAHVPVIAGGHISNSAQDQLEEVKRIADTGVDATILISNRFACDEETPDIWMENLQALLDGIDKNLPLGIYECPYPYKRLVRDEELAFCAGTGRFHFMKDTCCDLETLKRRAAILQGTPMKLYNANVTTLLGSLQAGCCGFSGILANFHPDLYVWLVENFEKYPEEAEKLQSMLTMCQFMEGQYYPVNAKYHLGRKGLPITLYSRVRHMKGMTQTQKDEVRQMEKLADIAREALLHKN